jgi:quinol monooxygenase YgiN
MPVLVAIVTPQPGKIDEAAEAFKAIVPAVHDEPGCELYSLHRNADKLVMIEQWADGDALATHGRSPALAALGGKLRDLTSEPMQLLVLEAVPVGDPAKGAL